MINGLGIVGWGVGGIEAEAGMLGQPVYFLTPDVVGVCLTGSLREGLTATDLALTVTQMLRKAKVVGKFVEFYGPGAAALPVVDRATVANMAPEYGATLGLFPIDAECVNYLRATGRSPEHCRTYENYYRAQGLFGMPSKGQIEYSAELELDLATVTPSVAGPKRPQDRIELPNLKSEFVAALTRPVTENGFGKSAADLDKSFVVGIHDGFHSGGGSQEPVSRSEAQARNTNPFTELEMANNRPTPDSVSAVAVSSEARIRHGSVLIAAITSCTNTSNPSVMLAAGLLAKKAVERGLRVNPLVKTSLAPGSRVVSDYLARTGLQPYLDHLGFNLVGYGCTTCIGNSGPLPAPVDEALAKYDLVAASVLSGNRNFEARIHQNIKANFLMSPPLVVAFALAGRVDIDLGRGPSARGKTGLTFISGTSGRVCGKCATSCRRPSSRRCSASSTAISPPRTRSGMKSPLRPEKCTTGTAGALTSRNRHSSPISARNRASSAKSGAPAPSGFLATASPRTTSRLRAASRRVHRPAITCSNMEWLSRTSTATARAGAMTA